MPNGSYSSAVEWEQERAFAPYADAIEAFARSKGLGVERWLHDGPAWSVSKPQRLGDAHTLWWSIQLVYDHGRFDLHAPAWMGTAYTLPEGTVREQRYADASRAAVASWPADEHVDIAGLLEQAYQLGMSYTEQDLTQRYATITGADGVSRYFEPQSQ